MADGRNVKERRDGDDDISGPQSKKQKLKRNEIRLPRFGVSREHDLLNGGPTKTYRVPDAGGGGPILVLDKKLGKGEASLRWGRMWVHEREGGGALLSALKGEELKKASLESDDVVRIFATDTNNVEYELHLKQPLNPIASPITYDLSHEWYRVIDANGLKEGDRVQGWGYRDVENDQLRLELRFFRE